MWRIEGKSIHDKTAFIIKGIFDTQQCVNTMRECGGRCYEEAEVE